MTLEVAENAAPEAVALFDGDTLLLVDANGEVIGEMNAPPGDADVEEVVSWLGPRRKKAVARLVALQAEKASLLAQIDDQYDPQINRATGYLNWLDGEFRDTLRVHAAHLVDACGGKVKSFRVGLLKLAFRTKPGRVEVLDEDAALMWAKAACPDAVKVKESVLVSRIPKDMELPAGASGLRRVPPSEVFEVI